MDKRIEYIDADVHFEWVVITPSGLVIKTITDRIRECIKPKKVSTPNEIKVYIIDHG